MDAILHSVGESFEDGKYRLFPVGKVVWVRAGSDYSDIGMRVTKAMVIEHTAAGIIVVPLFEKDGPVLIADDKLIQ